MKTIHDLFVDHPYYASDSNYFSNDCTSHYETWKDFYDEFGNADIDMNLCYRWDILETEEQTGKYQMQITIIGQRKGKYLPQLIDVVTNDDVPQILEYLKKHYDRMIENWQPISKL